MVYTHWVYSISQKVIADILFYNLNFAFKKNPYSCFFYVLHWLENELSVHFFWQKNEALGNVLFGVAIKIKSLEILLFIFLVFLKCFLIISRTFIIYSYLSENCKFQYNLHKTVLINGKKKKRHKSFHVF